ncbi:MAG: glycosyltransferase family 4 protein [Lachnobacterium sp.]|nr:glycosyltransferase family 4 protein [Lachnobacterium sp.]
MKRMLMMATTAAMIEQFNENNILILEEMGYEVHVAGNFKEGNPISEERLEQFKEWLTQHNGKWFHIPSTRKPTDINNVKAYKQIINLIKEYKYEFIHCHTPIGSVIARCAAHKTHTPIIYTAHGFHFYKGAPIKNWLIYYPVEKFLSRWTDVLILINKEDYERAKNVFHAKRTYYIPGVGIDIKKYSDLKNKEEINRKRTDLGLKENDFVILSVGELIPRKNHEVVIKAIAKLNAANKAQNIKYLICGKGRLLEKLKSDSIKLKIQDKVFFLGYRTDVNEICNCSDVFAFMSKQEGLSVALMEAMASGLSVICSDIRGNSDLIINNKNGMLIQNNVNELANAIEIFHNNEKIRVEYAEAARKCIEKYSLHNISEEMRRIYNQYARN